MLRTTNDQLTLWESVLPPEVLRNEVLLARAAEAKVLRTGRVRADTTVLAANVQRPTDSGLLAKAIGAMNRQIGRIKMAGSRRLMTARRSEAATRCSRGTLRSCVGSSKVRTIVWGSPIGETYADRAR